MSLAVLSLCASCIYAFFLLWGLLQERLSSYAYPISAKAISAADIPSILLGTYEKSSISIPGSGKLGAALTGGEKFRSPLFLNATQSLFCALIAAAYLLLLKSSANVHHPGQKPTAAKATTKSALERLGLHALTTSGAEQVRKVRPAAIGDAKGKGKANGHTSAPSIEKKGLLPPLLSRYLLISFFQSTASQLGFFALSQGLSYPTLTLAKSCKLVPVLMSIGTCIRNSSTHSFRTVSI